MKSLVLPYGFVALAVGIVSENGTLFSIPYTVADELNTILFTPYFLITSHKTKVPLILFS